MTIFIVVLRPVVRTILLLSKEMLDFLV